MPLLVEALLDICAAAGIDTLFGIPDPAFFALFDGAAARGWQVVAPHHEAAGGFMAEGAVRITGRPALCVGSLGPGIANAGPAMMHAMAEHVPVLFLGGARPGIDVADTRGGRFQHMPQMAPLAPMVKWAARADTAQAVLAAVARALAMMAAGTPGPAYVELAGALMDAVVAPLAVASPSVALPTVAQAAAAIAAARSPMILAGHGVDMARAGGALADLARVIACPVVHTPGTGGWPGSFAYGVSPAAGAVVAASDLVIAIGTRLGDQVHFGRSRHWRTGDIARRWIQIEADATAIGAHRPVDIALPGDMRAILPMLTAAVAPRAPLVTLATWRAQDAADRAARLAAAMALSTKPIHPARLVAEVARVLPDRAIYARDGGALVLFDIACRPDPPADLLWSQNVGHLGTGLPMAIGALVAERGQRPAVVLTGDSALLFHVAELETAARLGLPLVCVVGVDHQWGLEAGMARRLIGADAPQTGLGWGRQVRFDRLAMALGCHGVYVDDPVALADTLAQAITHATSGAGPIVIHAAIDPQANADEMPGLGEFASWFSAC